MRTHDLLQVTRGAGLIADDLPAWVSPSLVRAPFVVVRRAPTHGDLIPIGVRGTSRAERFPALLHRRDIAQAVAPESLAYPKASIRPLPALTALPEVAKAAARIDLVWGPAGSVGFELASGVETVTAQSDLDIVLRPTAAHARAQLAEFARCVAALDVRVDASIESDVGAVALSEWLASPDCVLIKTTSGPQLGAFSW